MAGSTFGGRHRPFAWIMATIKSQPDVPGTPPNQISKRTCIPHPSTYHITRTFYTVVQQRPHSADSCFAGLLNGYIWFLSSPPPVRDCVDEMGSSLVVGGPSNVIDTPQQNRLGGTGGADSSDSHSTCCRWYAGFLVALPGIMLSSRPRFWLLILALWGEDKELIVCAIGQAGRRCQSEALGESLWGAASEPGEGFCCPLLA